MNIEEFKDFLIQERLTAYCKANDTQHKKDYLEAFGKILQERAPSLMDTYNVHLDCYAEQVGQEKEEIYCFGVRDGIRAAKYIADAIATKE